MDMFWKRDNETEKKLDRVNEVVKRSFSNVKKDTSNIFKWLNYFYKKSMQQEYTIKQLQTELSYLPKTREDIRRIIDDYYSFEGIMAKIRDLNAKIEEIASKQAHIASMQPAKETAVQAYADLSHIEKRLEKLEEKKLSMKEKIMQRLTRNSKEYVKGIMLSYIKKYERISALQLKEIVVDEQRFCSKSSFYRLLDEIEELDDITVVKKGKEKHYLAKAHYMAKQKSI